jgi:hypothetical protein
MFSEIVISQDKNEKIPVFLSLLHLDHQKKIWLGQQAPFAELEIYLKRQGSNDPGDISLESLNEGADNDLDKDREGMTEGSVEEDDEREKQGLRKEKKI